MVIILRGAAGSGKTTLRHKIISTISGDDMPEFMSGIQLPAGMELGADTDFMVFAIEDYFTGPGGSYVFCREDYAANCSDMLQDFVLHISGHASVHDIIFVDQPNTSVAEISPYAAVAESFGHHVVVLELNRPREQLFERNVHRVPGWVIDSQRRNLDNTRKLVSQRWKLIDASNI